MKVNESKFEEKKFSQFLFWNIAPFNGYLKKIRRVNFPVYHESICGISVLEFFFFPFLLLQKHMNSRCVVQSSSVPHTCLYMLLQKPIGIIALLDEAWYNISTSLWIDTCCCKTFAATFLNLDFLCLQHVSKINTRNIFQQIVSEFPESPTIGESKIFWNRFYHVALCWQGMILLMHIENDICILVVFLVYV